MGFSHEFQADLEATHAILERAGLLLPAEQEDGGITCKFAMNSEKMPGYLASRIAPIDTRIEQFLEAFIGTACDFGDLPDEREWFSPAAMWSDAMRYLALAGYADHDGERYRWTDRIGQAMRAAHLWDDDCRSFTSIRNAALDQEAYLAWRSMPPGLREALTSRRMTHAEFFKVLALRWKDGRWHDEEGQVRLRGGGHMALVERVFALSIGNDFSP